MFSKTQISTPLCLWAVAVVLFFVPMACKKTPTASSELAKKFSIEEIDAPFVVTRGRATFQLKDKEMTTTLDMRLAKDSLIWLNARIAIIEGARVLIRRDSIFILDKINKKYYRYSFAELSQQAGFELTFARLQAIILGNLPTQNSTQNTNVEKQETAFVISQTEGNYQSFFTVSRKNKKLTTISVEDLKNPNPDKKPNLKVDYADFLAIGKHLFPHRCKAEIQYQKENESQTNALALEHKKVEFPTQAPSFPFSIPDNYTDGKKK
ncbi:DUF4292 domain-containing protein [Hugenholtzia roseola]|uniref:DUF4292 domain-containing protein n=1 Tax=Hugenholtzia roseola TaxID=1002 RepID=UPI000408E402|nr:DUF4292 domain-containing protein [Hugenholtzia roseola]